MQPTPATASWVVVARFGAPDTTTMINDVVAGGPGFVAVGETWQAHLVPEVNQDEFVHGGLVWTSPDGRTWTAINDPSPFAGAVLEHLVSTGEGLVAYGREHSPAGEVARQWVSSDGLTWQPGPDPHWGGGYQLSDVIGGGPGFVAVGTACCGPHGTRIWTSPDGLHWTTVFELAEVLGLHALARGPDAYVAVGDHDLSRGGVIPLAVTSADGMTWDVAPFQPELETSNVDAVGWLGSQFLATGSWSASPGVAVWQSPHGRVWQAVSQPPTDPLQELLKWGRRLSVAGGGAYLSTWIIEAGMPAGIWSSTDGAQWSRIISGEIPADAAMSRVIETVDGSLLMVGLVGYGDAQGVVWLRSP